MKLTRLRAPRRASVLAGAIAMTLLAGADAFAAAPSAALTSRLGQALGIAVPAASTTERMSGKGFTDVDADGRARYTVVLRQPALASYRGEYPSFARVPLTRSSDRPGRPDVNSTEAQAYVAHLVQAQQQALSDISAALGRPVAAEAQFQHALNAVVVRLSDEEVEAVLKRDDVLIVDRERVFRHFTYGSPSYIGATAMWTDTAAPNGIGYKGEGVVIGGIDSGINYTSNSFKATGDDGYTPVNPLGTGTYLGQCVTGRGDANRCNSKLIGMYNTESGTTSASGRDLDGHGTHTASTAGGNVVVNAPFGGGQFNLSGLAPHANVISYLACLNSCTSTTLNAAINQAVANGIVDVVNYSIGGPNDGPWLDSTDQAFLGALNAGIFVATAAGNDGPGEATTDSYAPWYTTVGATTPDKLPGFGLTVQGWSGTAPMVPGAAPVPSQAYTNLPLIESPNFADGATDGCTAYPANYFRRPQAAGGTQGIAVLRLDQNTSTCGSGTRRTNAANAGAIAVAYVDPEYINLGATGASYALLSEDWTAIKAAVGDVSGTTGNAVASISWPTSPTPRAGDRLAGFSSRGPTTFGTLKPDLSAPGDIILAAMSPTAASGYNTPATSAVIYGTESGTSMATPHITGAAALIRQAHRDWTPMEVKSAMMTTAKTAIPLGDGVTAATPNQRGAGRVDLTKAYKAGIVLNETGVNFQAANPATGGKPETLNLASYYHADCVGTCVFPRTVRSTGKATTWTLAVSGLPAGSYTLNKTSFPLGASGITSFSLSVNSTLLTQNQWYYGELTATPADSSIPTARFPIAIRPSTAKLTADTAAITASATVGQSLTRNVVITNAGNPSLNWSVSTTTLKGSVAKRKATTQGLSDRTIVTATTTGDIQSTNANNAYGADWFEIYGNGTTLAELQMSGFGYTSSTGDYPALSSFATQLAWRVWADNNGVPAGRPGNTISGDASPVFQFPSASGGLPVNATGLSYPKDAVRIDLAAAGAPATPLAPGRYWLNVAPSISGTATVFYQFLTQEAGKTPIAQYALPNSTTQANKAWRATTTSSLGGAGYTGYAMEVVVNAACSAPWLSYDSTGGSLGSLANKSLAVTFDTTGLAPGTYKAYVCLSGNGTSPPFMGQGQDSLLIPVTLTVNAVSEPLTATGAAIPGVVYQGGTAHLSVDVVPGTNPASSGIQVRGDLSSLGGSAAQAFTLVSGSTYAFDAAVPAAAPLGGRVIPVTVSDAQSRSANVNLALAVSAPPNGNPLSASGVAEPSLAHPGDSPLLVVSIVPGTDPASTNVAVTADLSTIGGSATQTFYDDATHGDAVAGDGLFSFRPILPGDLTTGARTLPASASDAQARTATTSIALNIVAAATQPAVTSAQAAPAVVVLGATTELTVVVAPGNNPPSTGLQVVADLSGIGGSATQAFSASGTTFTYTATVAAGTAPGVKLLPVTISDAQGRQASSVLGLNVPAQGSPTGVGLAAPATVGQGATTLLLVSTTPGSNPASTGLTVRANLGAIGGSATQAFYDDGSHGDQTAGDGVFSYTATVQSSTPIGTVVLPATLTDAQSRSGGAVISLNVTAPSDLLFRDGFEAP